MRIEGIDEYDAEFLVKLGIRNVEDLQKLIYQPEKLIDNYSSENPEKKDKTDNGNNFKMEAKASELGTAIVNDLDELPPELIIDQEDYIETPDEFLKTCQIS